MTLLCMKTHKMSHIPIRHHLQQGNDGPGARRSHPFYSRLLVWRYFSQKGCPTISTINWPYVLVYLTKSGGIHPPNRMRNASVENFPHNIYTILCGAETKEMYLSLFISYQDSSGLRTVARQSCKIRVKRYAFLKCCGWKI